MAILCQTKAKKLRPHRDQAHESCSTGQARSPDVKPAPSGLSTFALHVWDIPMKQRAAQATHPVCAAASQPTVVTAIHHSFQPGPVSPEQSVVIQRFRRRNRCSTTKPCCAADAE